MRLEGHFESSSTLQRNERVKLAASFWNNVGAGMVIGGMAGAFFLVSVRKHFESFESFVIQSGDLIREGPHPCGRRKTPDVTTAPNCDIRDTRPTMNERLSNHSS